MDQTTQIIARVFNTDKFVRITQNQVFQFSSSQLKMDFLSKQNSKKNISIFNKNNNKLFLKLINFKIIKNKKTKFEILIRDSSKEIKILIQGKEELQSMFKLIGYNSLILGLQEVAISLKNIGEGAFAQVYEVITNYQMRFAIKCFAKKSLEQNEKLRKSFENEISIMKKLKSKHIVSFDYVFETNKKISLKLQYFEKTLSSILLSINVVKRQKVIMRQLLFALLELKNKQVIHRDLKPDNIMIRKNSQGEEQCVLIDFGLATRVDDIPYIFHRCGTPGFIAPQIANLTDTKTKQTCAADMFSLGCIFYQLLTGHHIFCAKKISELLKKNRRCEYLPTALDKLSDQQKDLFLNMTKFQPNLRITPQDALNHPYFNEDVDDSDEIPEQQCQISKKMKKMARQIYFKNMDNVYLSAESIHLQSIASQAYHPSNNRRFTVKDSCLNFEFGPKQKQKIEENRKKRIRAQTQRAKTGNHCRQSRFSTINKPDLQVL